MALPQTIGQKIRNVLSKFNKQDASLKLAKNYDKMLIAGMKFSNEYQRISKIRHEFSESDMNFLNQRCPLSAEVYV